MCILELLSSLKLPLTSSFFIDVGLREIVEILAEIRREEIKLGFAAKFGGFDELVSDSNLF